jgi:hypothetical protein
MSQVDVPFKHWLTQQTTIFQKIVVFKDKDIWEDLLNDGIIPFCCMQFLWRLKFAVFSVVMPVAW